jgi:hypothetical protein
MEKKRTIATDIAEIAQKLDGKVNFESIKFSQVIFEDKKETGVNDLLFIGKKFGLYFYTSRAAVESICYLEKKKMPTYVATESTCNIYEIE